MLSYINKRFGNNKDEIEAHNAARVKLKGGWFGLTHVSVRKHYDRFKHMLRPRSPFIVAERDYETCLVASKEIGSIGDSRIRGIYGDVFDIFDIYQKSAGNVIEGKMVYRVPLFRYAHLDFCCTAIGLSDECVEKNIRKLSRWWCLKDVFHLEVVVAHRGDKGMRSAKILLEMFIPNAFEQVNWKVCELDIVDYRDTSMMRNAFYTFERKHKWRNRASRYNSEDL